jgi:hypothetical protein
MRETGVKIGNPISDGPARENEYRLRPIQINKLNLCLPREKEIHMIRNYVTAFFWLFIFSFLVCPVARTADLPPGTYMQSCTGPEMHGSTLAALCTSFFGTQWPASLADADNCNSTGHDIANVNGYLRCIYLWDPNGIGIISRSKDQQKDGNTIKVWRIDQPMVTSPSAVEYKDINFKPGDTITINAGGCAQTGGWGSTWKSYTNPQGSDAPTLYSGTIWIPGVIDQLVRIGGVLNRPWPVRTDLQPPVVRNLYLRLGYQDNDYSDNGYYSHDDGNNNQCLNVGPAWVEIKIVRPLKTPDDDRQVWSPASKPFDMVWDSEDTQGLPMNPRWLVQREKKDASFVPDFVNTCGAAFSGGNTVDIGVLDSICTSQNPYMDLDTSPFIGWSWPGGPGYCTDDGILHGHLNWAIATTTGTVRFDNLSTGIGSDDDYNLGLKEKDNSLLDTDNVAETASHSEGAGLSLEFNSDESIDQFQSPWWATLNSNVQNNTAPPNSPLSALNNGLPAVVIGLIGVDGVHGHGHIESHPVFAMAVETGSREDKDSRDETWAFFVRNSGNEGNCSELIHYWEGLEGKYYVQLPTPSNWTDVTDVTVASSNAWLWSAGTAWATVQSGQGESRVPVQVAGPRGEGSVVVAKDSQAMYLEVSLPAPVEAGPNQIGWGVNGEVTIHYVLKPNHARGDDGKRDAPANRDVARAKSAEDQEVNWENLKKNIHDPAIQQRVQQIFHTAFPGVDTKKNPATRLVIDSKVHDHKPVLSAHHGALTRPHRARDPRMEKMNSDLRQVLPKTAPGKD